MSTEQLLALNKGLTKDNYKPGDMLAVAEPLESVPSLPDLSLEVRRGIRGRKRIALTIDCGWVTEKDLRHLISVLRDRQAQASFFLTGIFLRHRSNGVGVIREAGFSVYNHSFSHPHCKALDDEQIQAELLRLEEVVNQQAPVSTRPYWRPPYGERDKRVLNAAAQAGFQSVYWTLDSHDASSSPTLTSDELFQRVCVDFGGAKPEDADPLDGAILLFHAGNHRTPDALDKIIPFLADRGYSFVDLPTLLTP